jgi:hypothetical protein
VQEHFNRKTLALGILDRSRPPIGINYFLLTHSVASSKHLTLWFVMSRLESDNGG